MGNGRFGLEAAQREEEEEYGPYDYGEAYAEGEEEEEVQPGQPVYDNYEPTHSYAGEYAGSEYETDQDYETTLPPTTTTTRRPRGKGRRGGRGKATGTIKDAGGFGGPRGSANRPRKTKREPLDAC